MPENYKQYDGRWAGYPYAGENMSAAGCGPTAVADIAGVLPTEIADWLTAHGYASNGYGTSWYGPTAALDAYGLNGQQLNSGSLYGSAGTSAENTWLSKMKTGSYYGILLMGPGNFTSGGHFICIVQTDANNRCYVHDPASAARDGWHNWSDFSGDVKIFYLADKKGGGGQPETPDVSRPGDWSPIGTATCTDNGVYFRSTPAIRNDNILYQLDAGNRFEIDGYKTGSWVRGYVNGVGVGYIHENYVAYDNPAQDPDNQPSAPVTVTGDSYTVQAGDTLSEIAAAMDVSTADLAAYNGISNPDVISVGQVIRKPGSGNNNQDGGTAYMFEVRVITLGAQGNDVLLLQEILKARGYYNGALDKSFGPETQAALIAYQTDRQGGAGEVDGVAGPKCWADMIAL